MLRGVILGVSATECNAEWVIPVKREYGGLECARRGGVTLGGRLTDEGEVSWLRWLGGWALAGRARELVPPPLRWHPPLPRPHPLTLLHLIILQVSYPTSNSLQTASINQLA